MIFKQLQQIESILTNDLRVMNAADFIARMDEFFRQIDQVVAQTVEATTRLYQNSPLCKAGCSHCCHQLLIVSYAEAVYIHHKLTTVFLPNDWLTVIRARVDKIKKAMPLLDLTHMRPEEAYRQYQPVIQQYNRLSLPCVFLSTAGYCQIYHFRPLACRDGHVFEGDPAECRFLRNPVVRTIRLQNIYQILAETLSEKIYGEQGGGEFMELLVKIDDRSLATSNS